MCVLGAGGRGGRKWGALGVFFTPTLTPNSTPGSWNENFRFVSFRGKPGTEIELPDSANHEAEKERLEADTSSCSSPFLLSSGSTMEG